MSRSPLLPAAALLVLCAAACAHEVAPAPAPPAPGLSQFGRDAGRGNLLGVQPWLTPLDYASPERLLHRLRGWLDRAAAWGVLNERTVVAFPEYMGAWLVAVDEGPGVLEADTIGDAMGALAGAHLLDFVGAMASSPAEDGAAHAAFTVRAKRMAEVHAEVFGALAREYGVTVTGASTLMPRPVVEGGVIVVEPGAPLENVVFTFHPDGTLDPQVVRKVFPIASEQAFVSAAPVEDIPVFDTPAGALGVLVCADSWYPESWRVLQEKGAELVAVPVFVEGGEGGDGEGGDGAWNDPWGGYSGHPAPADVNVGDIDKLTEAEAWQKYALSARAPRAGVETALTIPLRGALWDLVDDGQAHVVNGKAREAAPLDDAPMLVSVWR
jgi:predicted amidohydrolase